MNLPAATLIGSRTAVLIALLLAGHVFADFLVQSGRVAREKGTRRQVLLRHGLLTLLTHAVVVWPCWNLLVLAGMVLVAAIHTAVDGLRPWTQRRGLPALTAFLADQAVHALILIAAGWALAAMGALREGWIDLPRATLEAYARWAVIAAGVVFNTKGGTAVVRALLEQYPQVLPGAARGAGFTEAASVAAGKTSATEAPAYAMGRTIGVLERLLLYTLVLLEQWSALGFVVAAKSIARFRELESKPFADYYLIGTLTSLLVAITSGILVRCVVGR